MKIGGKTYSLVGEPLELIGTIKHISNGIYTPEGPVKMLSDMGPADVIHAQGIDIMKNSN